MQAPKKARDEGDDEETAAFKARKLQEEKALKEARDKGTIARLDSDMARGLTSHCFPTHSIEGYASIG